MFKKKTETSPTGEKVAASPHRILKAGTIVVGAADRRPGSNLPVTLAGSRIPLRLLNDTPVAFDGDDRDEVFVSILATNAENFELNIGSVPGTWSPLTGVRLPNECENCGAEIPATAADQKTCPSCLEKTKLPSGAYDGPERRVSVKDRRVQDIPLNDAPERRIGAADRRKATAPKAAKKKAAKKKAK